MVSGELEKSLRDEIANHIESRLGAMQEEVARLQSQLNEAFTRLLERAASESGTDTSIAATISEHLRASHDRGVEEAAAESARAKAASDMAIIKAAVDDLDNQRSQSDILNTLVNRAASFAPRVAFFVIKNEQAVGWRARGLEGTIGDAAVKEIILPLSEETPLSGVVKSRATWSGSPGANSADHLLLSKLGGEPPQRMIAIPLMVRGRSVAVLYADSAGLDANAINLEALETLVRVAGMAVELLSVTRAAPSERPSRPGPTPVPASAEAAPPEPAHAEAPQREPADAETPHHEPARAEAVAAGSEQAELEHGAAEQPAAEFESWPEADAVHHENAAPARHEAALQESSSAEQVAPAPEEETTAERVAPPATETATEQVAAPAAETTAYQPSGAVEVDAEPPQPATAPGGQYAAPLGKARQYGGSDAELPAGVGEEERRLHNDARRFARLLVSEIKLYNEQKVKEGRSHYDIYERLREDIDRSREMYDKRVAPPVAAQHDYFHQELVNTLAEGDPARLGDTYPGAAVSA